MAKYIGQVQGKFNREANIFNEISSSNKGYISKIGIQVEKATRISLTNIEEFKEGEFVSVTNSSSEFEIGKTEILELDNVKIISVKILSDESIPIIMDYIYEIE